MLPRLILLVISSLLSHVSSDGTFQLRLHSFTQSDLQCAEQPCYPIITLCLMQHQLAVPDILTAENCPLGFGRVDSPDDDSRITIPFQYGWLENVTVALDISLRPSGVQLLRDVRTLQNVLPAREPLTLQSQNDAVQLQYSIDVVCARHHYGKACSVSCEGRDGGAEGDGDQGHYACSPETGQKLCLHGWSGPGCDQPICRFGCNNGTCVAPNQCACSPGWQGDFCNQCVPMRGCMHGYCIQPYECRCEERWGGLYCAQDMDKCRSVEQPCRNNGQCFNTVKNDYTCVCKAGFTGRHCEQQTSFCSANPCKNGGECAESADGYRCNCPAYYKGQHCEELLISPHFRSCFDRPSATFHSHGANWLTDSCEKCYCVDGTVNCGEAQCSMQDCYSVHTPCPSEQVCLARHTGTCLTEPCEFPRGRCTPTRWIETGQSKFDIDCDANDGHLRPADKRLRRLQQPECSYFHMAINVTALPTGTTVEDLCYRLEARELFSDGLTNFMLGCRLVIDMPAVVKVSMRCARNRKCPVSKLRDLLLTRIHPELGSPQRLFSSVTQVGVHLHDVVFPVTFDSLKPSAPSPNSHLMLTLLILFSLLLLSFLCAVVYYCCVIRRRRQKARQNAGTLHQVRNNLYDDVRNGEDVKNGEGSASPDVLLPPRSRLSDIVNSLFCPLGRSTQPPSPPSVEDLPPLAPPKKTLPPSPPSRRNPPYRPVDLNDLSTYGEYMPSAANILYGSRTKNVPVSHSNDTVVSVLEAVL